MAIENIKLLVLDVDGVLTDGSICIDDAGRESKTYHVRDGQGLRFWQTCGLRVAILTGRSSRSVAHRAAELGIDLVEQGASDKAIGLENLLQRAGVGADEVACMGDDLPDLAVFGRVAYPIAVADAAEEVRQAAMHVTAARGGRGAVREAVEHLLRATGRWDEVLDGYLG